MDFEELFLDTAPSLRRNISELRAVNEKCFGALTNFGLLIKEIEEELNSKDIFKVPYVKDMIFQGDLIYTLGISIQDSNNRPRIYLTIRDNSLDSIIESRPLVECKVPEKIKCIPVLESFMNDYTEYYIKYIQGFTNEKYV